MTPTERERRNALAKARRRQDRARQSGQDELVSVGEVALQADQVPGQVTVFDALEECDHDHPISAADGSRQPCVSCGAEPPDEDGDLCGLCGMRRPVPGHTACSTCA